MWLVLHVLMRRLLAHRLIDAWPVPADIRRELAYSVSTLLVFAALGVVVFAWLMRGVMDIYMAPARNGWDWYVASLLRHVHGVHHRSRQPSPWAAYAFHPVEALINGLVTPLALLAVPLHWSVVLLFSLHQIVHNAHGHAAVENMPRGFVRHWFWGRFTTTTHHHLHHERARGNYGLWFTW